MKRTITAFALLALVTTTVVRAEEEGMSKFSQALRVSDKAVLQIGAAFSALVGVYCIGSGLEESNKRGSSAVVLAGAIALWAAHRTIVHAQALPSETNESDAEPKEQVS
jgi:hypothetical protein